MKASKNTAGIPGLSPGQSLLFKAAAQCFYEHGYHGTSVKEITDAVGWTPGALYHHYRSKQDLLMDIVSWFLSQSIAVTREALEVAGTDPVARLYHAARSHVLWNASDVVSSFVVNSEIRSLEPENRARNVAQRDELQGLFDTAVADGVASGVFTTPYPKDASRAVVTMCTAVASWYKPEGPLTPADVAIRYAEMSLNLVGFQGHPPRERA
ncbi:TetR family transcriptional regulator [Arthrobacter sp. AG258]|uniref:TetR/AcrR family transcriptional regulator n=1 Tax=Arthrobacter sp. AG258 TaxID=2183899 RepID=UPI0010DEF4E4|nr:TetR/AcrR family transcriptional regulator [Arthrobacter sp. AG258]TDT79517.1 TetR family transcriptional regulator [Arthrobacter sp. AG258]